MSMIPEALSYQIGGTTENTYQPKVQNRKAVVMFFQKAMPDGKVRIEQVFDAPVPFSVHHEMIETINSFRSEIFRENGLLYETKNLEIPGGTDNTIYALLVNTKTGKEIGRKVFNGDEAVEYMTKVRAELDANRAKARQYRETSEDFRRPIQTAMAEALKKKAAS